MPKTTPKKTIPNNNMSTEVTDSLAAINQVSRQLLSQLDSLIKNTGTDSDNGLDNGDSSTQKNQHAVTDEQLGSIVIQRMSLIEQLFRQHTQEQLSTKLPLINEMVSLDEQLILKSQQYKKILAERMLKIKQSKKVTKLYKKY